MFGVKARSFLSLPAVVVFGRDAFVPLVVRAPLLAHSTVVARMCSSAKNTRGTSSPLQELEGVGVRADKKSKMGLNVGPVQQHRTGRGSCNSTAQPHPGHAFASRVTARATEHQTALLHSSIAAPPLRGRAWRMLASR